MTFRRFLILLALLMAFGQQVQAQLRVEMTLPRRLFIAYEPVAATIVITNLSGRDVTLSDADAQHWFGFEITTDDNRIVPASNLNYHVPPLTIRAGESLKRAVNIGELYSIGEFGQYKVRASVYSTEMQRYFSSPLTQFVITEGKPIWEQKIGVPDGSPGAGSFREVTLLTFRRVSDNRLYVRIEDKDAGIVYTCRPLGRIITSYDPQIELDRNNQIHVLQMTGAKNFLYSVIGLNGEVLSHDNYIATAGNPKLKKSNAGLVTVVGGLLDNAVSPPPNAPALPKVSDRPEGFPKL